MKENEKKAFDFAADVTKQLITLSTAIITITITFSKDIISNFENNPAKDYLLWAWILFIATVFFGIWTLLALTGSLQPLKKVAKNTQNETVSNTEKSREIDCSINAGNVRIPSIMQIICFMVALSFTIVFGFSSLQNSQQKHNTKSMSNTELQIIKQTTFTIKPDSTVDTFRVK
ncbi:hypothetical protein [Paludibacter jiangxiensis]|uniref:Transmembrane protein n=1 Tax=Paludibacter jiangxiensis TaxID=681398 RepID=A0A171AC26_9BACT|nr:hypothetical protein [Paludibacter jiangxiensis]GAT63506.1 hypothetical protein PJIAN_444 [Paludibacter jiangxiensis]